MLSQATAHCSYKRSGVTRNNFQGKTVLRLEYEAYVPMALKKLDVSRRFADLVVEWDGAYVPRHIVTAG